MKTHLSRVTTAAMAIVLVAGCASNPAPVHRLRNMALITSGDVVSYGASASSTPVSIVDVDGKPVAEPYGPIELEPGKHTVTLKCDGSSNTSTVTVAPGDVYQFSKVTRPGVKGCVGILLKMRSASP